MEATDQPQNMMNAEIKIEATPLAFLADLSDVESNSSMENQNCENNCNFFEPLKNSKNLSCGHTICSKCQKCDQC